MLFSNKILANADLNWSHSDLSVCTIDSGLVSASSTETAEQRMPIDSASAKSIADDISSSQMKAFADALEAHTGKVLPITTRCTISQFWNIVYSGNAS